MPFPQDGTVDTTAVAINIVTEEQNRLKSILIQNTHATNNLIVYFRGKGNQGTTIFPRSNISLTVEGKDRISLSRVTLQGSAAGTTWEILSLIGPSEPSEFPVVPD